MSNGQKHLRELDFSLIAEYIIELCKKELLQKETRELQGIQIEYMCDGGYKEIGVKIKVFEECVDSISGGKGYEKYYTLVNDINRIAIDIKRVINLENVCKEDYVVMQLIASKIQKTLLEVEWEKIFRVEEKPWIDIIELD